MSITQANEIAGRIIKELEKVLIGQTEVLRQAVAVFLAGGHALLEGVPGTGKTLLAKALSKIAGVSFKRVQFTPDLMPSDIIGVNVYDIAEKKFIFRSGPVFTDLLLADEINRAPAKTQSALLEAMEERQVTVDGTGYTIPPVFTVFATQNPVEFEGTYPLPEAQVDRFMMKICIDYPDERSEFEILDKVNEGFEALRLDTLKLESVIDVSQLLQVRQTIRSIQVEESVRKYVTRIVRHTRSAPYLTLGASPRAAIMLFHAAKAMAVMDQRDYVTPDDVKAAALPVLRHRILLLPEAEVEGRSPDSCIKNILNQIEVPR